MQIIVQNNFNTSFEPMTTDVTIFCLVLTQWNWLLQVLILVLTQWKWL